MWTRTLRSGRARSGGPVRASLPACASPSRTRWNAGRGTSLSVRRSSSSSRRQPPPGRWEVQPPLRRLVAPGRPAELHLVTKAPKTRGLSTTNGRARALHTFLHHELQAAELMAWAVLAFPDTPREFRAGLVRIALDEVRHMGLYARADRAPRAPRRRASACATGSGSGSRRARLRCRSSPRWVSAWRARTSSTRLRSRRASAGGRRRRGPRPGARGARRDRARALRGALVRRVHGRTRLRQRGAKRSPSLSRRC